MEEVWANERGAQRNLPAKGFRPGVLLLGMGGIMAYGWYKLIIGMREIKYVGTPAQDKHPRDGRHTDSNILPIGQPRAPQDALV
jgi:hypothetical protein